MMGVVNRQQPHSDDMKTGDHVLAEAQTLDLPVTRALFKWKRRKEVTSEANVPVRAQEQTWLTRV